MQEANRPASDGLPRPRGCSRECMMSMGSMRTLIRNLAPIIMVCFVLFWATTATSADWRKKKKQESPSPSVTRLELQSELMAFSERFATVLSQALFNLEAQSLTRQLRLQVTHDAAFSMSSALTIAAGPNPDVSLLDLVILTTLGRMIYEEHWLPKYGKPVYAMVNGFRELEADIWAIAQKFLTGGQQMELRKMIEGWRKSNPEHFEFAYLRFGDFAPALKDSMLVQAVESGGLFGAVRQAAQQVEETRLLGERAMFLASRMPLLAGIFANVWLSRLAANPDAKEILSDLRTLSEVTDRLATASEELSDRIATERQAAIDHLIKEVAKEREAAITQFMDRLAAERSKAMEDLLSEEERVHSLLVDLRETLTVGNDLVSSVDAFTTKFIGDMPPATSEAGAQYFDVEQYRAVAAEASKTAGDLQALVESLDQLLNSEGLERSLTQLIKVADRTEMELEELSTHMFVLGAGLIVVFFIALFTYRYAFSRTNRSVQKRNVS